LHFSGKLASGFRKSSGFKGWTALGQPLRPDTPKASNEPAVAVGEGVSVRRQVEEKMMMNMMIGALILGLLMAKKNPVRKFGQMTLNLGGQALEYLKGDPKGIVRNVARVEWANKNWFDQKGWSLPPWVLVKSDEDASRFGNTDRVQDVAIIHDADPAVLPLLVYQASALQGLDAVLCEAQEDGALVEDDGNRLLLDMGDGSLKVRFVRNTKAGKFARFVVRLE